MRKRILLAVIVSYFSLSGMKAGSTAANPKLMIFGGENHETYLGCLNCSSAAADSIFNKSGRYRNCASMALGGDNLFCRLPFSEFGNTTPINKHFSACNSNASDPPVLVDEEGRYFGRFSVAEVFGHTDSVCRDTPQNRFRSKEACKLITTICATR